MIAEHLCDANYQRQCGWLHRVVVWLCRKHINRVAKTSLMRAYERSQIDSATMHEMAACVDRFLWPKNFR